MDAGVGGIHQHHGGRGGPPPLPGQHPMEVEYLLLIYLRERYLQQRKTIFLLNYLKLYDQP